MIDSSLLPQKSLLLSMKKISAPSPWRRELSSAQAAGASILLSQKIRTGRLVTFFTPQVESKSFPQIELDTFEEMTPNEEVGLYRKEQEMFVPGKYQKKRALFPKNLFVLCFFRCLHVLFC